LAVAFCGAAALLAVVDVAAGPAGVLLTGARFVVVSGVIAVFEKRPSKYSETPPGGPEFEKMIREGKVGVIHTRPLDLSIDEMLYEMIEEIDRYKARRLVIDSLSGFELALAPTFREDFRESLYRWSPS
jgi:circadian clock protein KaiC